MAKRVTYICYKCGDKIHDVVYKLTCYAKDAHPGPFGGISAEAAEQNHLQNKAAQDRQSRHLCGKCKDHRRPVHRVK